VITPLVHGTVIERTNLRRYHINGPEGGAFDATASGTCFIEELAFITFESAGTQYHGSVILMQDTDNPCCFGLSAGVLCEPNWHSAVARCRKMSPFAVARQPLTVAGEVSASAVACQAVTVA